MAMAHCILALSFLSPGSPNFAHRASRCAKRSSLCALAPPSGEGQLSSPDREARSAIIFVSCSWGRPARRDPDMQRLTDPAFCSSQCLLKPSTAKSIIGMKVFMHEGSLTRFPRSPWCEHILTGPDGKLHASCHVRLSGAGEPERRAS